MMLEREVMQYVDLSTSQHRHHNGGRNADRSQDVNRSPRFGGGIVTPLWYYQY